LAELGEPTEARAREAEDEMEKHIVAEWQEYEARVEARDLRPPASGAAHGAARAARAAAAAAAAAAVYLATYLTNLAICTAG
jgi:hypothetical protein